MKRITPMSLALLVALACADGCAHDAPAESRLAAHGDDRTVLVEFWASWCEPCHVFERDYLPDAGVQAALGHVRFVRYDVDSSAGSAAYHRLVDLATVHVPTFVAVVDDRVVRRLIGLPRTREQLGAWVHGVAALGGGESALVADLEAHPDDVSQVVRAARWYGAHHRRAEAATQYERVIALAGGDAELRAEADWQRGRWARAGKPRDPRAPVEFALAHPGTSYGTVALAILSILKDVSFDDAAAALRAAFDAVRDNAGAVNNLAYDALAMHQYDLALSIAQQAVRLHSDAASLDTLAEVYYYRHEPATAAAFAERAVALNPTDPLLARDLARFRAADGSPCAEVEAIRLNGFQALPYFYGDHD